MPSVSGPAYYEQTLSPLYHPQPAQHVQAHQSPDVSLVAQGEKLVLSMGKRKLPSPESMKQTPHAQPTKDWEEYKGHNEALVTPQDLLETDGEHKSKAAMSGRAIWVMCLFVCLFSRHFLLGLYFKVMLFLIELVC